MRFIPPPLDERLQAIGPADGLPNTLRRALQPGASFPPVPVPGANDWLANYPEEGQTFEQFVHSRFNKPDARRHTIYLQPLGQFAPGDSPPLDKLRRFATAFFTLQVEVLPTLDLPDLAESRITTRRNPYTGTQARLSFSRRTFSPFCDEGCPAMPTPCWALRW